LTKESEKKERVNESENFKRMLFFKVMFPAVLNNLARMLTESFNLIFIGRVKFEAEIIAAVGLGNMT
jgi:Na+-driven multidrug efflux pump